MSRRILIDMFHLQFEASGSLEKSEYAKIRRALKSKCFAANLRQTIRSLVRRYPSLSLVRVTVFS